MPKPKKPSTESDLDDALEQSFPASDPPSQSQPASKIGSNKVEDLDKIEDMEKEEDEDEEDEEDDELSEDYAGDVGEDSDEEEEDDEDDEDNKK